jgi:hypothetical protein
MKEKEMMPDENRKAIRLGNASIIYLVTFPRLAARIQLGYHHGTSCRVSFRQLVSEAQARLFESPNKTKPA